MKAIELWDLLKRFSEEELQKIDVCISHDDRTWETKKVCLDYVNTPKVHANCREINVSRYLRIERGNREI